MMRLERLQGREDLYDLSIRLRCMKREAYRKHQEIYDAVLKEMDRLMWGDEISWDDVDREMHMRDHAREERGRERAQRTHELYMNGDIHETGGLEI
jgi:hypothetical protein